MSQFQQSLEILHVLGLLNMVAPEKEAELEELGKRYGPLFFKASDQTRFILEANPLGFIQYSDRTLLRIWLLGWVMWKEMYCWSTFIWEFAMKREPFVLAELEAIPDQKQSYDDADEMYSRTITFIMAESLDWEQWPSSVPKPMDFFQDGYMNLPIEDWLINDLVNLAIAFIFLHELRHLMLHKDGHTFADLYEEEFECDRWATEYQLAQSDVYARKSGENPILVKSKRAMGIALGMAVIAHIHELGLWDLGKEHPPIAERMRRLAESLNLSGNDFLWNVASSFLLASRRRQRALPDRVDFDDQRELFTKLLARELFTKC